MAKKKAHFYTDGMNYARLNTVQAWGHVTHGNVKHSSADMRQGGYT